MTTYTGNTTVPTMTALIIRSCIIAWVKTGNYTSGTVTISLTYSQGSISGVARVTAYTDSTEVTASVQSAMGGTSATDLWEEGLWSDYRGWPSAPQFDGGRLWWVSRDITGSVSDGYESFDDSIEGDSAPIVRSIGSGPVERINWLLSLGRLLLGTQLTEKVVRSSSLDEPVTPTNFNIATHRHAALLW